MKKMQKNANIFKMLSGVSIPVWFMRQAGRYLPEYMELRKKNPDFLKMCYNQKVVTELTLQPIKRFDFDMAIIFSDILVILDALNFDVKFLEGIGPIVEPQMPILSLNSDILKTPNNSLEAVYCAINETRNNLSKEKALIGFIGAPWTLACYACEGGSSKDFHRTKSFAYSNQAEFVHLMNVLVESCVVHAGCQIEAGADAIQVFDSWSSVLDFQDYQKWVLEPLRKISMAIKANYPDTPLIWFPRGSFAHYSNFLKKDKKYFSDLIDCLSIDYGTPLHDVNGLLDEELIIQGNLDPSVLLSDKTDIIEEKVLKILEVFSKRKFHVFNLGHGILPQTKIENVHFVIDCIRKFSRKMIPLR